MNKNPHIGEPFDDFLRDEGIHEDVTKTALKQIPDFASDEHAEQFVRTATLSEYDLHGFRSERIGVATHEEIRARTLAIARGEIKPASDEPKVWIVVDRTNRK